MPLFGLAVFGAFLAYAAPKSNERIEAAVGGYYTGCMGGIVATIQEGMFKEGKTQEQALSNFNKLKANCKKQQAEYKDFLSN